jgi:hypothetical protein
MSTPSTLRRLVGAVVGLTLGASTLAGAAVNQASITSKSSTWLASQASAGYISTNGISVSVGQSAQTALALSHSTAGATTGAKILRYLWLHAPSLAAGLATTNPGDVAVWILAANAYGVSAKNFGGVNLVSRLMASFQGPSGKTPGLFGTEDPTYDGTYRQGLALAALRATATPIPASAVAWLKAQQCPSGAFSSDLVDNPCSGLPANYAGPDTNSTAAAIIGLEAAKATVPSATLSFVKRDASRNGGWGFYPTNQTDPNSTALMLWAAATVPGSATSFGSLTKATTALLSAAAPTGGFIYPGNNAPDVTSTEQALQALSMKPLWAVIVPSAKKAVTG